MSSEENIKQTEILGSPGSPMQRLVRWGKRFVLTLFVLLLLLYLLLHIPAIQNALVQKVTRSVSETLGTEVSIKKVSFGFLNKVVLEDFFVEGAYADTLLFSQKLKAKIHLNPVSLIKDGIFVRDISLEGANFTIYRPGGAPNTNIQAFLQGLFPPNTTAVQQAPKKKNPLRLDIETVRLKNVHFTERDSIKGKLVSIFITGGALEIDDVDLANKNIAASSFEIFRPIIRVEDYIGLPPPPSNTQIISIPVDTSYQEIPDTIPFKFTLQSLALIDGKVSIHNWKKAPVRLPDPNIIDYKHLEIYDVDLLVHNFSVSEMMDNR